MDSLGDAVERIEARRKTLEVYTSDEAVFEELDRQFSTRNVRIARQELPPRDDAGFVVVRGPNGAFLGTVGVDHLRALLAPDVRPPWVGEPDDDRGTVFDFLENTIFTSFDRRQMLATAREIEERAWRTDDGSLYVGFQNAAAFEAQAPVYDRFASERDLRIRVFVEDVWAGTVDESIEVVAEAGGEIGAYWLVVFDAGDGGDNSCGLVAEERSPDRFYGFWTYDSEQVGELASYLESTYVG